jgi:hypothetical protein
MTLSIPRSRPALFQSVRSSRDLSLVAFAAALFAAFALQAGAFLPRLSPAPATEAPRLEEQAPEAREPSYVAARHGAAQAHGAPAETRAVAAPAPCETPRG